MPIKVPTDTLDRYQMVNDLPVLPLMRAQVAHPGVCPNTAVHGKFYGLLTVRLGTDLMYIGLGDYSQLYEMVDYGSMETWP